MSRLPMPPGYQATEPLGGWKLPLPEPGEIRLIAEPPCPSWWLEHRRAILEALGLVKPEDR